MTRGIMGIGPGRVKDLRFRASADRPSFVGCHFGRNDVQVQVSFDLGGPFTRALIIDLLIQPQVARHSDGCQSQLIGNVKGYSWANPFPRMQTFENKI